MRLKYVVKRLLCWLEDSVSVKTITMNGMEGAADVPRELFSYQDLITASVINLMKSLMKIAVSAINAQKMKLHKFT